MSCVPFSFALITGAVTEGVGVGRLCSELRIVTALHCISQSLRDLRKAAVRTASTRSASASNDIHPIYNSMLAPPFVG